MLLSSYAVEVAFCALTLLDGVSEGNPTCEKSHDIDLKIFHIPLPTWHGLNFGSYGKMGQFNNGRECMLMLLCLCTNHFCPKYSSVLSLHWFPPPVRLCSLVELHLSLCLRLSVSRLTEKVGRFWYNFLDKEILPSLFFLFFYYQLSFWSASLAFCLWNVQSRPLQWHKDDVFNVFSPFIYGECVVSTVSGSTYLWSANGWGVSLLCVYLN